MMIKKKRPLPIKTDNEETLYPKHSELSLVKIDGSNNYVGVINSITDTRVSIYRCYKVGRISGIDDRICREYLKVLNLKKDISVTIEISSGKILVLPISSDIKDLYNGYLKIMEQAKFLAIARLTNSTFNGIVGDYYTSGDFNTSIVGGSSNNCTIKSIERIDSDKNRTLHIKGD